MRAGLVSPLNIPAWRDFPLLERLAAYLDVPVAVDNDAKALALGEGWVGAAAGERNFIGDGRVDRHRRRHRARRPPARRRGRQRRAHRPRHRRTRRPGVRLRRARLRRGRGVGHRDPRDHRWGAEGRADRRAVAHRARSSVAPSRRSPTSSTCVWRLSPVRWRSASANRSSERHKPRSTIAPVCRSRPERASSPVASVATARSSAPPPLAFEFTSRATLAGVQPTYSRRPRPTARRSRPSSPSTCPLSGAASVRSASRRRRPSPRTGARRCTSTATSRPTGRRSTAAVASPRSSR